MDANPARSVRIDFSASGSEYFRIWIVNLLLIVVTLGFYLPFAKARRLRYFYANTAVGGQALAFHGDPWKMLRGYVLMLLLFGAYAASGHVSSWLSLVVFGLLALLWPALWRSSLRFRLGNTSWRGLRFGFEGGLKDAYAAMGLVFVPGLLIVLGTALVMDGIDPDDTAAMAAAGEALLPWMAASFLAALLLLPVAFWLIKRYQHNGYRYAQQATQFSAGLGSMVKWGLKVIGVGLLAIVAFALMVVGLAFVLGLAGGLLKSPVIAVLFVLLYVAVLSLIGAYVAAEPDLERHALAGAGLRQPAESGRADPADDEEPAADHGHAGPVPAVCRGQHDAPEAGRDDADLRRAAQPVAGRRGRKPRLRLG
jgi:uncharacterized membrane protein YjgN (DUF898 family)